ncbi:nuclear transport factor 2 family protein [Aliarcobacter butzleri]|uniref:nuclear transport factor 2 family protein n=1 Tax=Aliarcobacter butzleri TaxID=28197 RepID=UPI00191B8343|nr:nuclear transport factor 2 family protein [Aliarcobacter butzleri]
MIKNPKDILEQWMQSINNGNVENLLSLYDKDAVLIPTFSNRLLNTPDKLKNYFEKLESREELSIALHEKTLLIQELKNEIYSLSGIYNWRFAVDGELLNFEARFSYIIDLSKPNPILHHHSSQIPRTL